MATVARPQSGRRQAFLQGAAVGFLALPGTVVAGGVALLVVVALGWIGKFIIFLLTPLAWLMRYVILPFLHWLATPLFWLWENFLREALLWLATPAIWLWRTLIEPASVFVLRYVVRPLVWIALRLVLAAFFLLPVSAVGVVVVGGFRGSLGARLNRSGLFSLGVAVGFTLLDCVALEVLDSKGIAAGSPSLGQLLLVALTGVALVRLMVVKVAEHEEPIERSFRDNLGIYVRHSGLEMLGAGFLLVAGIVARFAGAGSDGD